MKKRKIIYRNLFFVLFIIAGLIAFSVIKTKVLIKKHENKSFIKYIEENTVERTHETGMLKTMQEYTETYSYFISYPQFQLKNVDEKINEIIQNELTQFKSEPSKEQMVLYGEYASFKNYDNLSSIVMKFSTYSDVLANPNDEFYVLNINEEDGYIYQDGELLNGKIEEEIVRFTKENYQAEIFEDADILSARKLLFFQNRNLEVLFPKGEIAPSSAGEIRLELNQDALKQYLLLNTKGKQVEDNSEPTTVPTAPIETEQTPIVKQNNKKLIALSFDDGPNYKTTPQILDILEKYNVHATFFMLGMNVEGNQSLVQDVYKRGNEIGNHSYDHKSFSKLSENDLSYEISETNKLIQDVIGVSPTAIRPPYGDFHGIKPNELGLPIVLWNIDSEDWKSRNPKTILEQVKKQAKENGIILMHDIYQTTVDSLENVLQWLESNGYQVVSVKEMMELQQKSYQVGDVIYDGKK